MLDKLTTLTDARRRRRFGAYYTPTRFASPLVSWGLRDGHLDILDPSYGGCSFLHAALDVLESQGTCAAGRHIHGVDIAPEAAVFGDALHARGVPASNLITEDFFAVKAGALVPKVDLVVGNPPYIRHHWFQGEARERAVLALAHQKVALHGRSNAWAYFVVHATSFLREGGRMALLLPGAALFAEYASKVLDVIAASFASSTLVRVGERVFDDAREATTILLAEGYGCTGRRPKVVDVDGLPELEALLSDEHRVNSASSASVTSHALPDELNEEWARLLDHSSIMPLGTLAKMRIGVVTGANQFFIVGADEACSLETDGARTLPVIARARHLASTSWRPCDQAREENSGASTRLVVVHPDTSAVGVLEAWIHRGEADGIDRRFKCAQRSPWYDIGDIRQPDAFMRSLGSTSPLLVQNLCGATCTNTIHRLWWRPDVCPADVLVGAVTSFFQLACELAGQVYGGGVLKINLGIARKLPVPVVRGAGHALPEIDRLLRAGELTRARTQADKVVSKHLDISTNTVEAITAAAAECARRRTGRHGGA